MGLSEYDPLVLLSVIMEVDSHKLGYRAQYCKSWSLMVYCVTMRILDIGCFINNSKLHRRGNMRNLVLNICIETSFMFLGSWDFLYAQKLLDLLYQKCVCYQYLLHFALALYVYSSFREACVHYAVAGERNNCITLGLIIFCSGTSSLLLHMNDSSLMQIVSRVPDILFIGFQPKKILIALHTLWIILYKNFHSCTYVIWNLSFLSKFSGYINIKYLLFCSIGSWACMLRTKACWSCSWADGYPDTPNHRWTLQVSQGSSVWVINFLLVLENENTCLFMWCFLFSFSYFIWI